MNRQTTIYLLAQKALYLLGEQTEVGLRLASLCFLVKKESCLGAHRKNI
jgi:hypothetical protein